MAAVNVNPKEKLHMYLTVGSAGDNFCCTESK